MLIDSEDYGGTRKMSPASLPASTGVLWFQPQRMNGYALMRLYLYGTSHRFVVWLISHLGRMHMYDTVSEERQGMTKGQEQPAELL